MSAWRDPCKDGKCGSPYCPRSSCSPTKIVSARGGKKTRAADSQPGYEVVTCSEYFAETGSGRRSLLLDTALRQASEMAKREKKDCAVLVNGRIRFIVRKDGARDFLPDTLPGA